MLVFYVVQGPKIILTDLVNNSFYRSIISYLGLFLFILSTITLELNKKKTCMQKIHLIREKLIKSTNVVISQNILQILVHIY